MYCGFCGEPILDTAKFCPKCGGVVSNMAQTVLEDDYDYEAEGYESEAEKKKKRHPGRIVLAVVLIIAVAAAAVFAALKLTGSKNSDEVVQGQSSVTSLVQSYLFAAQDRNLDSLTALYFPGSESLYDDGSSEDGIPASDLLAQEDAWTGYYGKEVSGFNLESSDFADLSSSKASSVASIIQKCSGIDSISELFTVPVDVTYADGTTVQMIFEVVQTDLGCFLVEID